MKVQQHGNVSAVETRRRRQKIGIRCFVLALSVIAFAMVCLGVSGFALYRPKDINGNLPSDVVRNFIKLCEAEDYAAARKLWYGPSERGTPKTLEDFCARYKKIGLENCIISKANKGKAGFWHVSVDFEERGKKKHVFFFFKIVDGEWRMPRGHSWGP